MVKSPCRSGYRRSPKTHRCKPKSAKHRSTKKSSKHRSTKRKSIKKSVKRNSKLKSAKKSSKRRSSKTPKTPKSPARHFTVGTRRKGRNEKMWKVAETTAGNLKWVQCGPAHKCTGGRASGPFYSPKSQLGGNPLLLVKTAAPYLMQMQAMKDSPKKKKFLGLF
jgi:hypothetical protein